MQNAITKPTKHRDAQLVGSTVGETSIKILYNLAFNFEDVVGEWLSRQTFDCKCSRPLSCLHNFD